MTDRSAVSYFMFLVTLLLCVQLTNETLYVWLCCYKLMMVLSWAGWDFCATRIETVTAIATRRCCIPSATCWRAAIVHSSKHTQISASLVAIGPWLTRITRLTLNISAPSLVLGQCQATREELRDCVALARVLNYRLLHVCVFK